MNAQAVEKAKAAEAADIIERAYLSPQSITAHQAETLATILGGRLEFKARGAVLHTGRGAPVLLAFYANGGQLVRAILEAMRPAGRAAAPMIADDRALLAVVTGNRGGQA